MLLRSKGCLSEPNITKLYSLRNVPVDLLHQVWQLYAPWSATASSHTHWCCGVTNDKRRWNCRHQQPPRTIWNFRGAMVAMRGPEDGLALMKKGIEAVEKTGGIHWPYYHSLFAIMHA
jgi:hypothetical protein